MIIKYSQADHDKIITLIALHVQNTVHTIIQFQFNSFLLVQDKFEGAFKYCTTAQENWGKWGMQVAVLAKKYLSKLISSVNKKYNLGYSVFNKLCTECSKVWKQIMSRKNKKEKHHAATDLNTFH